MLVASLAFTKMMLQHRQKELEYKDKTKELDQDSIDGKSLTESELVNLIRAAVRDETGLVLDRIKEVEERLNALDAPAGDIFSDEEIESERKTIGRASKERS